MIHYNLKIYLLCFLPISTLSGIISSLLRKAIVALVEGYIGSIPMWG